MQQRDRCLRRAHAAARVHTSLMCAMLRRWPSCTVTRNFGDEEEIGLVRLEAVLDRVEVDAVQDDDRGSGRSGSTFGLRLALERRFDDQLVKAEDVAQHGAVGLGRFADIRPHHGAAVRQQPRRVEAVHQLGATASVDEVANQSPTLTLSAACAAARRATGTRYGEQLT